MAEYAFTFGARLCLIKTYLQVAIGGARGYIAFPFVVEDDRQSLRPLGDREGQTLSFFAQTEQGALAQASESLGHRFGPPVSARDAVLVASIRHVQLPALIDDQRATLTVLALQSIRAGDYVMITDQGATPLTQAPWPKSGAILGRALEGIDTGHRGRVRNVSSKIPDIASFGNSEVAQRAWKALQRYTGWLGRDRPSNNARAAVDALGVVLDQHGGPRATAAAIAKVRLEVERLHAVDLKQLFRNALHDLSVDLDSAEVEQ
jgi:hypothetical protein